MCLPDCPAPILANAGHEIERVVPSVCRHWAAGVAYGIVAEKRAYPEHGLRRLDLGGSSSGAPGRAYCIEKYRYR